MQKITLWAVTSNTDLTEGRGHEYDVGYLRTKDAAEAAVKDKRYSKFCCMGVQGKNDVEYMVKERIFTIYDNHEDFFQEHDTEARFKAIRDRLGTKDMEFLTRYLQR